MQTRKHDPIAVALGLALAILPATAQVDPESICAKRADTLFKSGSEALDQMVPAGVQDCSTLESTIDPDRSAGSSITVPLEGGFSYDHAVVKTLPGESARSFSAVGVPAWASFDSEYGVFSGSPSCEGAGSYAVEFNVDDSDMPLVVNYEVSCPSSFNVYGLDWQISSNSGDGVVDDTERFGYFGDSDGDKLVDAPVTVRENRLTPQRTYLLASTDVALSEVSDPHGYIEVGSDGASLLYDPPSGSEGASGTYVFDVCAVGAPSDCQRWSLDYVVTPATPEIAGLGEERWGAVTNPILGNTFLNDIVIDCQLPTITNYFAIPKNTYDPGESYGMIENQGNGDIDFLALDESTGRIAMNPTCADLGQYDFSVRIESNSGNSGYRSGDIVVQ